MSRKAREDKSAWKTPSIHALVGDYGPFTAKGFAPIENVTILVMASMQGKKEHEEQAQSQPQRHPMYELAGPAQQVLLSSNRSSKAVSGGLLVLDVSTMFETTAEYLEALDKELRQPANEKTNVGGALTKGFGKSIFRLLQRLLLRQVTLMASGELCGLIWKIWRAAAAYDPEMIGGIQFAHPVLSAEFVNLYLTQQKPHELCQPLAHVENRVVTRKDRKKKKKKSGKTLSPPSSPSSGSSSGYAGSCPHLDLLVHSADDKVARVGILRALLPLGATKIADPTKSNEGQATNTYQWMVHAMSDNNDLEDPNPAEDRDPAEDEDEEETAKANYAYDPDMFDSLGKSLFVSKVKVEMNRNTKQYERNCEDVTRDLLTVTMPTPPAVEEQGVSALGCIPPSQWERQVGALVLRGNRCVLARSLKGEWQGMRIPSVVPKPNETPQEAAKRALEAFTEVDAKKEADILDWVLPVSILAPNGRPVVLTLYALYATEPPPDGPLEDADLEDDETPYDWYTWANVQKRLDESSLQGLQMMAL